MSTRFFRWQDSLEGYLRLRASQRALRCESLDVAVDVGPQVLRLEMDPCASDQEKRQGIYGRRRSEDGLQVIKFDPDERFQSILYPSIAALPEGGPFVSASVLAQKAKAVDDGIVAALEQLLDDGAASFLGRAALLGDWQGVLRDEWDRSPEDSRRANAIGLLSAARSLAGDEDPDVASWPAALRLRRSRYLRDSRTRPELEVPLGIYSWDRRLAGLYRQGKLLQQPLPVEVASVLAGYMESDEAVRSAYEFHISLSALTIPLVGPDLLSDRGAGEGDGPKPAVFPASETPEGRLVKRLVGNNPVPPGFDLIGELIARVGDGRVSLAPTAESGWYDHVLYALEPLILPDRTPEAGKLRLAEDYRDDLKDLFRSLLAAARESHVKQIQSAYVGGCPLVVSPHLTFEPLAEHYLRRAASYRFVRERLVDLLGEGVLLSRNRLTPRGETGGPLLDELITMEQLFTGAWAIVLDDLGMPADVGGAEGRFIMAARAAARSWASSHRSDPDLGEDVRMMVPLFKDIGRGEFHVLAMVGFEQRNLKVSFVERPGVTVRDARGRVVEPYIHWSDASYPLARPVTLTCRTKRLLDRDQFRALCDRAESVAEIRSAIEA
jgi:hypothetical protein